MNGSEPSHKTSISISHKIIALSLFLVSVSLMTTGGYSYYSIGKKLERNLGLRLEHIARTGALMIPMEDHQKVVSDYENQSEGVDQTAHFKNVQSILKSIQIQNELSSDVYTFIVPEWAPDQMIFMTMSNEKTYVGNGLELQPTVRHVLRDKAPKHTGLYYDKEGAWVSAFAPLFDKNGNIYAVLEVDYRAEKELAEANMEVLITLMIPAAVAFILSLLFGSFLGRALTRPIAKLQSASQKVAQGDLDVEINVSTRDEIGLLANHFQSMVGDLKVKRAQLEDYSKNLEKKVEERTSQLNAANKTISAILESLGQGFLVFDRNGQCLPYYSKVCEDMFGKSPANRPIWEVLDVEEDKIGQYKDWLGITFNETLPFSSCVGITRSTYPNSNGRYITLEYKDLRDKDDQLIEIILIATDKTDERNAQETAERERNYTEMVLKMLHNRDQFALFLSDAKTLIMQIKNEIKETKPQKDILLRNLHTLKGGAGMFSMGDLRESSHQLETEILDMGDALESGNQEQILLVSQEIDAIDEKMQQFLADNQLLFEEGLESQERQTKIPISELTCFGLKWKSTIEDPNLYREFVDRFIKEPIHRFFSHYDLAVDDLSQNLGKSVAPISYQGAGLKVVGENYKDLFGTFIHSFRNSIDHGIEDPETRMENDKPEEGRIEVSFSVTESNQLRIKVKDDGAGIDPTRIRQKLDSLGMDHSGQDDHQVIQNIFASGFSTSEDVTDISGRGVGMEAIRFEAEKLNGHVEVFSKIGEGTTLVVDVPMIEHLQCPPETELSQVA